MHQIFDLLQKLNFLNVISTNRTLCLPNTNPSLDLLKAICAAGGILLDFTYLVVCYSMRLILTYIPNKLRFFVKLLNKVSK